MSGFDSDSDSDPDTDSASPVRSMKQSKTRNRFGIKTQVISTASDRPDRPARLQRRQPQPRRHRPGVQQDPRSGQQDLLDWADDPDLDRALVQPHIANGKAYDPTGPRTFMTVATRMRLGGREPTPSRRSAATMLGIGATFAPDSGCRRWSSRYGEDLCRSSVESSQQRR